MENGKDWVCRVWAVYRLKMAMGDATASPSELLGAICHDLSADTGDSPYFGLSGSEEAACEGSSHYEDGEITLYLEPGKREEMRLILLGRADGMRDPDITPPLVWEQEADSWGSLEGTRRMALSRALDE